MITQQRQPQKCRMTQAIDTKKMHSRLRVLRTARLATGLAAASHFDGFVVGKKCEKMDE
jgi:hypothetical protein